MAINRLLQRHLKSTNRAWFGRYQEYRQSCRPAGAVACSQRQQNGPGRDGDANVKVPLKSVPQKLASIPPLVGQFIAMVKDRNRIAVKCLVALPALLCALCLAGSSVAGEDPRQRVQLPEMMQQHMLANMRDHLTAINEILEAMAKGQLDKAAQVAEARIGMSSLELHGASHMSRFMPEGMREAGTAMHRAASRFALKAQEGDALAAYAALSEVTSACVACHSAYRIR